MPNVGREMLDSFLEAQAVDANTPVHEVSTDAHAGQSADDKTFWSQLARELHDGVTQNIWYLQTELSGISDRLVGDQSDLREELDRLKTVAQEAYQELRDTLDLLHSRTIQQINLDTELAEVSAKFSEATRMDVSYRCTTGDQNVEVSGDVGKQVRRLVQEALWNSYQHSMSDAATVVLKKSQNHFIVMVTDNGCGFSPDEVDVNHYGLRNMRERAEAINGKLYLTARAGEGTTVTLHIPQEGNVS